MKTLNELIKPPFAFKENKAYNAGSEHILSIPVSVRRALGEELYPDFRKFVSDALGNEYERQFGEPLRWLYVDDGKRGGYLGCPKCGNAERYLRSRNYCPKCGQRLLAHDRDGI